MLLIDIIPQEIFVLIFEFCEDYLCLYNISDNINNCIKYYKMYKINLMLLYKNLYISKKIIPIDRYIDSYRTPWGHIVGYDNEYDYKCDLCHKKMHKISNNSRNIKKIRNRQKYSQHRCIELMNKSKKVE